MRKNKLHFLTSILLRFYFSVASFLIIGKISAQIQPGCVNANFGVDADFNANQLQFGGLSSPNGKDDWFKSATHSGTGLGVLDTTGAASLYNFFSMPGNLNKIFTRRSNTIFFERANNTIQVDALFAKDYTGSTGGHVDSTAYATGSKNGMPPSDWDATTMPVQGKNDILDVYGHLRRAGTTNTSPLWLFMGASMADPNGTRYMDFEFFQKSLTFNPTSQFTSAGSEEGHTAFKFDNTTGKITETGDLIFSMAITGGAPSDFEIRVWVSRAIYNSTFNPSDFDFDRSGAYFDGASNGSAYGYARIIPKGTAMLQACGIVNSSPTPAGPWGTLNSDGVYTTNYSTFQFAEFGFNLSSFGIDPLVVKPGASVCTPAFSSYIVKTRASASFTAALKDFAGPYVFGGPQNIGASITGSNILTCDNTSATLTATASQASSVAYYTWTAPDGTKQSGTGLTSITATQTGIYTLEIAPVEGCPVMGAATFNLIEDKVLPPVATNPQSASYCVGGSPQALSVMSPGIGYQVRWFNTETGGTVLSTGATYTPTVAGTYYAETRNTTNGCTCARIPVTLTEVADPSVSINVSEGSICLNGSTILTASVANGTGTTIYQWQSSLDNVSFTNIVGEINAILNIANLNTTTHYRVIVSQSGNGCGTITSFSTRITVNPSCNPCNCQRQLLHNTDFENGTANGWVTGIVGQSGTAEVYIYNGGPTGKYAALNYRDYNSTTGDYYIEQKWNNIIPGRTYIFSGDLARHAGTRAFIRAEFYNASNQLLSQTTDRYATTEYPTFIPFSFDLVAPPGASYIRIVGFANRTALKMDNVKLVTCFEPVISFANLNDANTCTGGSVTFNTILSDPSVVVNYQWQSSLNGTTWTNITGATSSSLTVSPTVTTFYRVNATPTNGSCSTTSSYPLKVTIYPDPTVSVSADNASICTGSSTVLTATVTNGTGTTTYQWQSSSDNVTFNNVAGATNATFNTGNLTTNQFYKVVINRSGNGCNTVTSSVSPITTGAIYKQVAAKNTPVFHCDIIDETRFAIESDVTDFSFNPGHAALFGITAQVPRIETSVEMIRVVECRKHIARVGRWPFELPSLCQCPGHRVVIERRRVAVGASAEPVMMQMHHIKRATMRAKRVEITLA